VERKEMEGGAGQLEASGDDSASDMRRKQLQRERKQKSRARLNQQADPNDMKMADARHIWHSNKMLHRNSDMDQAFEKFEDTDVAQAYLKGIEEGELALSKASRDSTDNSWGWQTSAQMSECYKSFGEEKELLCVQARNLGFLTAAGFLIFRLPDLTTEIVLDELCNGLREAQKARGNGEMNTEDDFHAFLLKCMEAAAAGGREEPVFEYTLHPGDDTLRKDLQKRVSQQPAQTQTHTDTQTHRHTDTQTRRHTYTHTHTHT
jgi:hypothetical protein